jgi:hypothetical protein
MAVAALAFVWVVTVALNPWALHIGGRSTPLLYWHGMGSVMSKDGKTHPLYVTFWPGKPQRSMIGRREGKRKNADLSGRGWLCVAPGTVEKMDLSGTMYGGYSSSDGALFDFRSQSKLFIDHATVTLRWATYEEFEAACRAAGNQGGR